VTTEPVYQSYDWSNEGYFRKGPLESSKRRQYAIEGMKRELIFNNLNDPPMTLNPIFGVNMEANVKRLQKSANLQTDGVIGPNTAKALLMRRILQWQTKLSIPLNLVCKQLSLESSFYGACYNTTNDHSYSQLHDPLNLRHPDGKLVCPDGDLSYAYRPGVNVRYCGEALKRNFEVMSRSATTLATNEEIWMAAVGAWNAPAWAADWIAAGLPKEGGGELSEWFAAYTGCKTRFEWMTKYTNMVLRQPC